MMKIACFALLGLAASVSVGVPETEGDASTMPALITGENPPELASALLETSSAVQKNQNLRARILAQMSSAKSGIKSMQSVALSASANLLGTEKSKSMVHSLMQTEMDSSMNQAVQVAVSMKSDKRVTLEELLVVEDKAQDAMDTTATELAEIFTEMMSSHKQCGVCKSDCNALQFKKWKVHTMTECQKNCKINICKEATQEETAQFEQERQQAPKYATSKFSSYIEDYSKANGQQELVVDDEGKFDVVWEMPGEDVAAEEELASDPVEQLRAMDKFQAQKSSEDILKNLHMEAEAQNQQRFVAAIQ
jgi:hypothetical protein